MRAWSLVVLGVGIGLSVVIAPLPAEAESATARPPGVEAPTTEDGKGAELRSADARRRYREGNAAMKLHQWQKAHEAYLAAFELRPHWQVAGSLGEVELELGRYKDAALHLTLFLRESRDVPPAETKRVQEWLSRARARVSTVTIASAPPGAELLLDGVKIGRAPLREEVYVEPGKHTVAGNLGRCATTATVDVVAGESKEIALRCDAAPPAERPRVVGPTAAPIVAPRVSRERRAIVITGAGFTVASLALGITSVALFTSKGSRAAEAHETASGPNAAAEASFKSVALWSFVAAGLVGGGTLAYALKSHKSSRAPVSGSLVVGPMGGAAMVRGEF